MAARAAPLLALLIFLALVTIALVSLLIQTHHRAVDLALVAWSVIVASVS